MSVESPKQSRWLVLNTGAAEPAWNMAVDEALLETAAETGVPVLRFYGWTEPAATFGYSQRYEDLERITALRPLIRRPTGGGLVSHLADWTYSLTFPHQHFWAGFRAEESYRRAHEWVCAAFKRMGVPTELAPEKRSEAPGQCFIGAEKDDVLWHGKKIAGAAQRRPKTGLLIQGSVQPPPIGLNRAHWEQAMSEAGTELLGSGRENWVLPGPVAARAEALRSGKYLTEEHNRKR